MKIRCLIIDDEPLALRVLERYAGDVSYLEIAGKCSNALEAMEVLHRERIDLLFLDINMPKLTGIEFLKTQKHPPIVIITTAYAEYALQGYELNVIDYLMKPFSFDRFLKAVQKAEEALKDQPARIQHSQGNVTADEQFIFIKSSKKTYNVSLESILYIEALGDYVKVFTPERMIISYQSLKNIETLLPPRRFPRIHKSFIVSLSKIEMIEGNHVKIRDRLIPIGTNYKAEFEKLILSI
jgi:DNA-binding LytR/AlgR family response regulator